LYQDGDIPAHHEAKTLRSQGAFTHDQKAIKRSHAVI
jgi:hypothetical protein